MRSPLKRKILFNVLLIFMMVLLCFCKGPNKKTPKKIDPAFSGYIKSFTGGLVSNNTSIIIKFNDAVLGVNSGDKIEKSLFKFSPSIKGEAYWKDIKTIEFKPENRFPSGEVYDIQFALSEIIQVPDGLKTFKFQVEVKNQALNVEVEGMIIYDENELTWQKLIGKINTADFAENINIEKVLSATQKNKALNIQWEHSGGDLIHKFIVDSIFRGNSKGEVIISWDGKPIGIEDEGGEIIDVSPLGDFKVLQVTPTSIPEQYITIYFSDPLDEKQDLEGLIHLKNNKSIRLAVNGNEVRVYPKSRLQGSTNLIIEDGIRNSMGYQLHTTSEKPISFSSINPQVKLIGKGVILPSSKGLIFPFKAVNLSAVNVKIIKIFEDNVPYFLQQNQIDHDNQLKRYGRIIYYEEVPLKSEKAIDYGRWNTFALDLAELIKTEPGAIYRVVIDFNLSQSLHPCNEEGKEEVGYTENKKRYGDWDRPENYYYSDYEYDYRDDYRWDERNNPCKQSYYLRGNHTVARNVFASDLGIIAKGGNSKNLFVAISDLITTDQLSDVDIEIYNLQNRLITKAKTNSEGIVNIEVESKPFLLIARKGKQIGYLRLDDGSSLSLSMFNVSGNKTRKGVKGLIYGERGVWRPGDSLFVTFVLEDKNRIFPKEHPVVFELYTPENQLYLRKIKTNSINGFYDFRSATAMSSPTGNWMAKVIVGGSTFTKTLKIETIKPNRLKIILDFKTKLLSSKGNIEGKLKVKWLHGAIAKNLKSEVILSLSKSTTRFADFYGFSFDDPSKYLESEDLTIFEGNLNDKGIAKIKPKISIGKNAPGMVKATFKTKAFEKGGDFSVDRTTMSYSPYESYVGVKIPEGEGWNKSIYSNEANLIPIVTVDENGKPIDRENLEIEVYELRWRWWWEHDNENDLASYLRYNSSSRIRKDKVSTKDGKAMYEMDLNMKSWGRKLIRITDPVSGHSTGQLFYTSYKGWWNNSGQDSPGGAEMLTFKTDKEKYNVGEEVKVELPSAKKGKALISIESGSKVIETYWLEVEENNSTFSFEARKEMSPNVYIHVSFLQPHNQTANDLPIRLYGIQQIRIEDPLTHLSPVINMPDVLEPEKEVSIQVSESNGKEMTYTLAVVDEGLLDLTKFRTPNAWSHFYAREALGVKTWDMYKYVMGAFTGEFSGLLAIGGDEDMSNKEGKKANRFKPVVKFFGPIHLSPSSTNTHTFTMPNYIGSVKTMIVAGNQGSYGKVSKATPVKKPLMVLATFPRVVSPGESVKLPVSVFAMDEKIKTVKVNIQTNDYFNKPNQTEQTLEFTELGDQLAYFDLNVIEKIGIGRIKVIATSGNERAEYDIELDVRIPNPRISDVINKAIEPNEKWETTFKAIGLMGTNNGMFEISGIPPLNLEKRLKYLIRYPHGCIEQTTSAVFPQLVLSNLLDLDDVKKAKIENNIKAGIKRIKTFQLRNGGMSYWPGYDDSADDWGTSYAGHFMIEAKALGYTLPYGFLSSWVSYQQKRANEWISSAGSNNYSRHSSQVQQAYRLYTLALAGKPAIGPMNRLRELSSLGKTAKWRLAAAYYLAGRSKIAKNLIKGLDSNVPFYRELSYTYGSSLRDQAMILETLTILGDKEEAYDLFKEIQEKLNTNNWYSTQSTAYTLMAISKFIGTDENGDTYKFNYKIDNGSLVSVESESPIFQLELDFSKKLNGKLLLENNSGRTLFAKIHLDGIPLTGDKTNAENDLKMNIRYLDMEGTAIDPETLIQGTDFMAEIKLTHPGSRVSYKEMALTQIFPSGWEIHNIRMDGGESIYTKDKPTYQDIRDDRVYTYFNIPKGKSKTFRILLNASYLGKFYLPTVYCEAMYDNDINAHKAGKWVNIIKEPIKKAAKETE